MMKYRLKLGISFYTKKDLKVIFASLSHVMEILYLTITKTNIMKFPAFLVTGILALILNNQHEKPMLLDNQRGTVKCDAITNDRLIADILDNDLAYKKLIDLYHPKIVKEQRERNIHDSKYTDKIITYSAKGDSFTFYKGNGTFFLVGLTLTSPKLILLHNIQIGSDKSVLKEKFKKQMLSDKVCLSDLEGGSTFTFAFKNNKLIRIEFIGLVD